MKKFTSITQKVTAIILVSLIIGIGIVVIYFAYGQNRMLHMSTENNLLQEAEVLRQSIKTTMMPGETSLVVSLFNDIQSVGAMYDITLYRRDGVVAFTDDSTIEEVNTYLETQRFQPKEFMMKGEPIRDDDVYFRSSVEMEKTESFQHREQSNTYLTIYQPLHNELQCTECHGIDHTIRGVIAIQANMTPTIVRARNNIITASLIFLGIVMILFLLLSVFLKRTIIKPIQQIGYVVSEVTKGNFREKVSIATKDEIGTLGEGFNHMLEGLKERDFIRATFGRYLSDEVVTNLLESPSGLDLGGELRELTMLVSDLRGFSSMVSRLPPHTVISITNRYLTRMIEIITQYQGTVDEFQGDGILVFFGAPLSAEDDPERAVACAIAMQNAIDEINLEQRQLGLPEFDMGIGINTGEVIVGNIGSERRTKYGAMGSAINIAYRIESYTIGGQILISQGFYERVQSLVQVGETKEVQFKGMDRPVTLYELTGIGGPYQMTLPTKAPKVFTTLTPPLAITCYPVQGKTVAEATISGYITALAVSSAKATLAGAVAAHDNLKISMVPEEGPPFEMYAKVVELHSSEETSGHTTVSLEFTALTEDAKNFLEHRRTTSSFP